MILEMLEEHYFLYCDYLFPTSNRTFHKNKNSSHKSYFRLTLMFKYVKE